MSWNKDDLWEKAVLFMERATSEDRESHTFPLWAAMGLELLARSAVSNISPLLLAEPDKDHRHALHALGYGSGIPKSISTAQALSLCKTLLTGFTDEEFKSASSLIARRNEELHTGNAAFASFPTQSWLPGFFRCCKALSESMQKSLDDLFGEDEAKAAHRMLEEADQSVLSTVKSEIAAHRRVFLAKEKDEREKLSASAKVTRTYLKIA